MSRSTLTRRESLRYAGGSGIALLSSVAGCLGRDDDTSSLTRLHEQLQTMTNQVPDRPYTKLLLNTEQVGQWYWYPVVTTRPRQLRHLVESAGMALDRSYRPLDSSPEATFHLDTAGVTYAHLEDGHTLEDEFISFVLGTELSSYRGFSRYLSEVEDSGIIRAFSEQSWFQIIGGYVDDLSALSKELIDAHHGDRDGWVDQGRPHRQLAKHLPQGVQTRVVPISREDTSEYSLGFGQTATWPDDANDTVHLRTVIVYDLEADSVSQRVQQRISGERIGLYPITDPSITITDNVAIIDDTGSASEVVWR